MSPCAGERDLLLREVNYRVGNSLQIIASMLHLQGAQVALPPACIVGIAP
jgi:two-component sensor histidine kinase